MNKQTNNGENSIPVKVAEVTRSVKILHKHILPMILTVKSQSLAAGPEMINVAGFPARTMSSPSPHALTLSGSATTKGKGLPADNRSLICM